MLRLRFAVLLGLAAVLATPADAQRYGQYARATVAAPEVLGMGGAGVALAAPHGAFFYNPAHFARLGAGVRANVLGARARLTSKFFDDVRFALDEVEPALQDGIAFPLTDAQRDLFDRALTQGARPTVGGGAVLLPSVMVGLGSYGLGAGLFATNTTRYHFEDAGAGVPLVDLFSQADAMAVVGGGAVVPGAALLPGSTLAVGAVAKYARRFVGMKRASFLDVNPDGEAFYVVSGSTVAVDLGVHLADAVPTLPGRLDFGLALYDALGGAFDYAAYRTISVMGEEAEDPAEEAAILDALADRDGAAGVRLGAAYTFPGFGPVKAPAVAVDWVSYGTSEYEQPALTKLRLGTQAGLGPLALRAGLSQGYVTAGAGLHTRFFRLDYAFYGVEDGRLPGQLPRYNHLLQLRFGLY